MKTDLRIRLDGNQGEAYENLSGSTGVYVYEDRYGEPLYIGSSDDLGRRLRTHQNPSGFGVESKIPEARSVWIYLTDDYRQVERDMTCHFDLRYNGIGITTHSGEYEKVTYYLEPRMIKAIKRQALEEDKDISGLIREILGKYLKNK